MNARIQTRFFVVATTITALLFFSTIALAAAGALDTTFDSDGKVLTNIGGDDSIQAMAIQSDGKIITAGYTNKLGGYDFVLARYNSDGTLDTSFDGDGIVITDILSKNNKAFAVAIQPLDGLIVVGGEICYSSDDCDFALARYHSDGSLDAAFDGDGIAITDYDGQDDKGAALAIQADNKIIAFGYTGDNFGSSSYLVVRYNDDGSLDVSFDADGRVITGAGVYDYPGGIVIQPDGRIIVVGTSDTGPLFSEFFISVIRLNPNGSLDTSFDGDGRLLLDFPPDSIGNAIALMPNGRIVVAGVTEYPRDFALVRLNSDGSYDSTFGNNGKVITDFGDSMDWASAALIQLDGKIIVGGTSDRQNAGDFALTRYNRDGSLDTSFSGDGKLLTSIKGTDAINGMALQSDGKIVVAGQGESDFALARYDDGGLAFTSVSAQDGWILESAETSNRGGTLNSTSVFRIGDDALRKQYRSILSFQTNDIPDNAVITQVTLKIKRQSISGFIDPVVPFQGFMADIKKGFFGDSSTLQIQIGR